MNGVSVANLTLQTHVKVSLEASGEPNLLLFRRTAGIINNMYKTSSLSLVIWLIQLQTLKWPDQSTFTVVIYCSMNLNEKKWSVVI